jgi:long-subunit fatty acid transport protein
MNRSAIARWVGLALIVGGAGAEASIISAPSIGTADTMVGNLNVAEPHDGESILLHNAAGVADLRGTEVRASVFFLFSEGKYANPAIGYEEKSSEVPIAPVLWLGTDALGDWKIGAGLYGTTGASYSFGGDPALGIPNRFLSELSVIQLGLVAGREVAPGLRIGFQLAPTYSSEKVRIGTPLGPVSFDLDGFGISGTAGILYDLGERTTFGVGYRAPGIVYTSGDADVGEAKDEVDFDFHTPQSVTFGLAHRFTERVTVYAHSRWSDYTEFEKSIFDFERTDALDQPLVSKAKDRFRYGAGIAVELAEGLRVACGASREEWMMEEESLTPLLYDTSDVLVGVGGSFASPRWKVDAVIGRPITEDRVVTADSNPRFPGRYEVKGGVAGLSITYRFAAPD